MPLIHCQLADHLTGGILREFLLSITWSQNPHLHTWTRICAKSQSWQICISKEPSFSMQRIQVIGWCLCRQMFTGTTSVWWWEYSKALNRHKYSHCIGNIYMYTIYVLEMQCLYNNSDAMFLQTNRHTHIVILTNTTTDLCLIIVCHSNYYGIKIELTSKVNI